MGRDILCLKMILKTRLKIIIVIDRNLRFKKNFIKKYSKQIKNKNISIIYIKKKISLNRLRYAGAIKTQSKYILFIDDDDNIEIKNLLILKKKLQNINTDIVISKYIFKHKKKKIIINPFVSLFGRYSPFIKTITPGGGTIFNRNLIINFYNSNFAKFEDWCLGIDLIYKLRKSFYLNNKPFYLVNYRLKKEKNFLNTLKFRFNFSKKFGILALFHSTISYIFLQLYIKFLK